MTVCRIPKTPMRGKQRLLSGTSAVFMFSIHRLIGQSFSALCASSLEDVSAIGSCHSLSEAVLFFSLTLFGLIGSEHDLHLLSFVFIPDSEMVRNDPEAFAFQPKIRFYTMTSYIKPQIHRFVKNFFSFFSSFFIFYKKECFAKAFYGKWNNVRVCIIYGRKLGREALDSPIAPQTPIR